MKRALLSVHALVKQLVAQGTESKGPEKVPQVRCTIWTLRKKGVIELLLQEYTLGRRAQSHELRLHKPQRK